MPILTPSNKVKTSIVLLFVTLALIACAIALSKAAMAQANSQPRCSFKINGGDFLDEIPAVLYGGDRLKATCEVQQEDGEPDWEGHTELDNVEWHLTANFEDSTQYENSVSMAGMSGSVKVELLGDVPIIRIPVPMTDELIEPYQMETAPPRSVRVIFLRRGEYDHRAESIIVHKTAKYAREKLEEMESAGFAQPMLNKSRDMIEEGRPWQAIELMDTLEPMVESTQSELDRATSFWHWHSLQLTITLLLLIALLAAVLTLLIQNKVIPVGSKGGDTGQRRFNPSQTSMQPRDGSPNTSGSLPSPEGGASQTGTGSSEGGGDTS